jgi:30S ribosomal protein S31
MGKGDKRTRRGKIFAGSYGKTRQRPKGALLIAPTDATETVSDKPAKKRAVKRIAAAEVAE